MGLLREIAPDLKRAALPMHTASSPAAAVLADLIAQASQALGLEAEIVPLQERARP